MTFLQKYIIPSNFTDFLKVYFLMDMFYAIDFLSIHPHNDFSIIIIVEGLHQNNKTFNSSLAGSYASYSGFYLLKYTSCTCTLYIVLRNPFFYCDQTIPPYVYFVPRALPYKYYGLLILIYNVAFNAY